MIYDFDKIVNRFNTNSIKWDQLNEMYGNNDILPMWIADMDFEVCYKIKDALLKRVNHGIFGYNFISNEYLNAVTNWMKRRHDWTIKNDWIRCTPGVVPALNFAINTISSPGDEIIIQTPVYFPFARSIKNNGRIVVENPLIYENNTYKMDLADLESKITNKTRAIILCNPHNPVGRVWTKKELTELGNICLKHNVFVLSDEIHSDIIYKGNKQIPFASISDDFAQNSITCTSPSKTFNIAGLQVSNIIIPNERIRNLFTIEKEKFSIEKPNILGCVALIEAYNECEDWVFQLLNYLESNLNYLIKFFEEKIKKIKVIKPQGTYLVWLDCSELNMNANELKNFFVNKAKIGLDDGIMFGRQAEKFERINIACPRKTLEDALNRIEKAVSSL